jgi:hypothetical protein
MSNEFHVVCKSIKWWLDASRQSGQETIVSFTFQVMGDVGVLIKEMQEGCRRPLFLGIQKPGEVAPQANQDASNFASLTETPSSVYPESESGSAYSVPRGPYSKRTRTEPSKLRPWDEVSTNVLSRPPSSPTGRYSCVHFANFRNSRFRIDFGRGC